MAANPNWVNPDRLNEFLDEIGELQLKSREVTTEISQIRQAAKLDGINLDVANQLALIRFRNPKDEGVAYLNELVEYARLSGLDLEVFQNRPVASLEAISSGGGRPSEESIYTKQLEQVIRESEHREPKIYQQVLLGIAFAAVLMWLVH